MKKKANKIKDHEQSRYLVKKIYLIIFKKRKKHLSVCLRHWQYIDYKAFLSSSVNIPNQKCIVRLQLAEKGTHDLFFPLF